MVHQLVQIKIIETEHDIISSFNELISYLYETGSYFGSKRKPFVFDLDKIKKEVLATGDSYDGKLCKIKTLILKLDKLNKIN